MDRDEARKRQEAIDEANVRAIMLKHGLLVSSHVTPEWAETIERVKRGAAQRQAARRN